MTPDPALILKLKCVGEDIGGGVQRDAQRISDSYQRACQLSELERNGRRDEHESAAYNLHIEGTTLIRKYGTGN